MKSTNRDDALRLRPFLQGALLLLSMLWVQMGIAATCTYSGTNAVYLTNASVRLSAPAGTVVWKSPLTTTRISCTEMTVSANSPVYIIFNTALGSTTKAGSPIDATQINAQMIWSRKISSGGQTSGTASGTNSLNTASNANIGTADNPNTPFVVDITWQILLTTGTGPVTRAGIKALPHIFGYLRLDGNRAGAGFDLLFVGLDEIRPVPTTCAVSADDVRLPTIRSQQLMTAGQTGGDRDFTINLRNCTEGGGVTTTGVNARAYFDGAAIDIASGRLNIDAGGPNNLQVQLLDNNNGSAPAVINLAGATAAQGVNAVPISNGVATMRYVARYYPTAPVTSPGRVATRVNYTIEYP